jgi:hypothetical protein
MKHMMHFKTFFRLAFIINNIGGGFPSPTFFSKENLLSMPDKNAIPLTKKKVFF